MIERGYLERIARDIAARTTRVELNGESIPIRSAEANGTTVTVYTDMVAGITRITSIRIIDERGDVIVQRTPYVDVVDSQQLEFRFEFEVKGA